MFTGFTRRKIDEEKDRIQIFTDSNREQLNSIDKRRCRWRNYKKEGQRTEKCQVKLEKLRDKNHKQTINLLVNESTAYNL